MTIDIFVTGFGILILLIGILAIIRTITGWINPKVQEIPTALDIEGIDVMTVEQIVKDNGEFANMETVLRYLYTKEKLRDGENKIGFINK